MRNVQFQAMSFTSEAFFFVLTNTCRVLWTKCCHFFFIPEVRHSSITDCALSRIQFSWHSARQEHLLQDYASYIIQISRNVSLCYGKGHTIYEV